MTRTQYNEAVHAKQGRGKATFVGLLFATAFAISIGSWWLEQAPPEPNYSGYYDGPWVNKRGELVSADGHVLKKVYTGPDISSNTSDLGSF